MSKIYNWLFGTSKERAERDANAIFQITEYSGDLWLTYNGALVCPTEMLYGDDSVKALKEIRELYVERNTTEV